jgi:hypothetical protein
VVSMYQRGKPFAVSIGPVLSRTACAAWPNSAAAIEKAIVLSLKTFMICIPRVKNQKMALDLYGFACQCGQLWSGDAVAVIEYEPIAVQLWFRTVAGVPAVPAGRRNEVVAFFVETS